MEPAITDFINDNKIATVCFITKEGKPYCINCFYLLDEENHVLMFKSSSGASHDEMVLPNANIAGTILPDSIDILKIKGIQFSGKILSKEDVDKFKLSSQYTKKYPFSLAMPGYIWGVLLERIKYTNNTLGFGNKTIWNLSDEKK
ncbi:MAG: hypothetical protein IPJ60_00640 [Sphingobacteriaceae bacterium]|nr:hypothetical protein [Sphingobacteriaceae bacterium]